MQFKHLNKVGLSILSLTMDLIEFVELILRSRWFRQHLALDDFGK